MKKVLGMLLALMMVSGIASAMSVEEFKVKADEGQMQVKACKYQDSSKGLTVSHKLGSFCGEHSFGIKVNNNLETSSLNIIIGVDGKYHIKCHQSKYRPTPKVLKINGESFRVAKYQYTWGCKGGCWSEYSIDIPLAKLKERGIKSIDTVSVDMVDRFTNEPLYTDNLVRKLDKINSIYSFYLTL